MKDGFDCDVDVDIGIGIGTGISSYFVHQSPVAATSISLSSQAHSQNEETKDSFLGPFLLPSLCRNQSIFHLSFFIHTYIRCGI